MIPLVRHCGVFFPAERVKITKTTAQRGFHSSATADGKHDRGHMTRRRPQCNRRTSKAKLQAQLGFSTLRSAVQFPNTWGCVSSIPDAVDNLR